MTDDDLRAALVAADPARSADLDPLTSPRARELLERAMTSDLITPTPAPSPDAAPSRRPWLAAAAAAVLVMGAGATYLATTGNDPTGGPAGGPSGGEVVLALPVVDPLTTMSCLPVSEGMSALAQMTVALAGTATAVSEGEVRLDVSRWYRGGDAGTVVLRNAPEQQQSLVGATDFAVGEDYLVSASDGSVSVCGLTGPVSPDLQAAYDQAYGG